MSSTDFSIAIGTNISDFQAGMVGVRNSVSNTVNNINAQFNQFNETIAKTKAAGTERRDRHEKRRRKNHQKYCSKSPQALIRFGLRQLRPA